MTDKIINKICMKYANFNFDKITSINITKTLLKHYQVYKFSHDRVLVIVLQSLDPLCSYIVLDHIPKCTRTHTYTQLSI